ncbi:hypothetical protein ACFFIX_19565 [Metabacillus herbersteinensis]|uniref:Uncharacterized protein n=1 Tax=Metabacillus herbersteinensis TaxID=283816 RepID=A0ABV6GIR4_9BACI
MLLDDRGIDNIVEKMQNKNLKIEKLMFKYNPENKFVKIDGDGIPGIIQEDDFFENFKDNLIYSDLSWLEPLCKAFRSKLEAEVKVDPEGDFQHDKVNIEVNLNVPSTLGDNFHGFLYPRFKTFVKFYPFIKSVQVRGYQSKVKNIFFKLEVDGKKVNKMLKDNNINNQYLNQWLIQIEKCERDNINQEYFCNTFRVINGKINYEAKTEVISEYFKLKI